VKVEKIRKKGSRREKEVKNGGGGMERGRGRRRRGRGEKGRRRGGVDERNRL